MIDEHNNITTITKVTDINENKPVVGNLGIEYITINY